jgi:inorganic pyrophosphatase
MEPFWRDLDKLINTSEIIIDRPKGSQHPRYKSIVYPIDYGYLKGTTSSDNQEIDVWVGSNRNNTLDSIICTIDVLKKDIEIKLLLGCTEEEKDMILKFLNNSEFMSGILIKR